MKRKRRSPIHDRLLHLREAQGLRQEDVAKAADVDKSAVCHWETGDARPDIGRLPKIAIVLKTTVDDLIEGDEQYEAIRNAFGAS